MHISIQKWGNSAAIRLHKGLLDQLNTTIGDTLEIEIRNGGLFIKPSTQAPVSLEELLEGSPKDRLVPTDEDRQWMDASPTGKEVL